MRGFRVRYALGKGVESEFGRVVFRLSGVGQFVVSALDRVSALEKALDRLRTHPYTPFLLGDPELGILNFTADEQTRAGELELDGPTVVPLGDAVRIESIEEVR